MRNAGKVLIIDLTNANLLLPVFVFANDESRDIVLNQPIDDEPTGFMEIVINFKSSLS